MVEYISAGGKKHPVRVYYKAIMNFQKETGKTIDAIDNDLEALGILFYYSLERGYEKEGKKFNITKEEAIDLLDDCWFDFQKVIYKFFPTVDEVTKNTLNKTIEEEEKEIKKKQ